MPAYLSLQGNFAVLGGATGSARMRYHLGDRTVVELDAPFLPLNGRLVLVPVCEADGPTGLRIDLSQWQPGCIGPRALSVLPVALRDQAIAAEVARAFDADPHTSWQRIDETTVVRWLKAGEYIR
jgi:hypothetical protein